MLIRKQSILVRFEVSMNTSSFQKEVEVKLELRPASLRSIEQVALLKALKAAPKRTAEVSVYFDTNKQTLRKHGLLLRVRKVGNRHIQTIKASGNFGPFERDEWEVEISGNGPDLRLAKGTPLERVLTDGLRRQLKPIFETRVKRTVYQLSCDEREMALMVDHGTIDTGDHSLPLCEIELELERGSVADLFDVGRELIQSLPARLALKSKAERGYELINGTLNMPVKAAASDLPASIGTRDAFKIIGLKCLKQVVDNASALIKGDPEGVHQMRVGLRRLRAGMSLFADLLRDPQTVAIKEELKWLTSELGPAREFEVLVNRVMAPIKTRRRRRDGMRFVSGEIAKKREAAIARAQNAVQSARFAALTFEAAAWLYGGRWTTPRDELVRDRGDLPVTVFAAEQLTRRWRKLRKKRKAFAQLDARGRHRLRIQAKKLRYAVEFFATLFTDKRATKRLERLLPVLERLQDSLGDLNDIAVDEARLATMGIRRRSDPNRVFAAGLLTGREDARIEEAEAAAAEAYAALAKIKPFWL
jgi:triphosphatase